MSEEYSRAVIAVAENLQWFSRRQMVDAPIMRLTLVWERRFTAQGLHFVRNGIPKLTGLTESDRHQAELSGNNRHQAEVNGSERNQTEARAPKGKAAPIDAALSTMDLFKFNSAVTVYNETLPEVFAAGAQQTARDAGVPRLYTTKSDMVGQYLKDHAAEKLGKDVDATTRGIVRNVLVKGYDEGWTRARLVKEVKGTFAGFNVPDASRLYRSRAEVIAVNELGTAYSKGALQSAIQIEDADSLIMEKYWAPAAGPCALCSGNVAAGWIAIRDNFPSGHDCPTGHPRCRCSLLTRVKNSNLL